MLIEDDELNLRLCLRIELQKFAIVFAVRRDVHKGEMCPLYCTQQTQGCLSSFRVKVIWTTSILVEVLSATSTPIGALPSVTSFSKSSSIPSVTSTLKQPPLSPSKLPPSSLLLHRHPHIQHLPYINIQLNSPPFAHPNVHSSPTPSHHEIHHLPSRPRILSSVYSRLHRRPKELWRRLVRQRMRRWGCEAFQELRERYVTFHFP
jgi:hypothetical protein